MSMNGAKASEVITIDSSDDEGEQVAAAAASGHKKSPNSSTVSAKKQSQEVIALLDDSSDDDDENPAPKMDRKRKARPCIEDEIIEMESSVNLSMACKPAARKRAAPKNSSVDNNSPVIPFYLFETTSAKPPSAIPNKNRKYFQTLREAIGLDVPNRQIQWLIISNFLVDFRYVYEKLPDVVQIPRVVVFYGSYFGGMDFHQGLMQELIMKNWKAAAERNGNTVDFIRLVPGDPPKSKTNPLPVKITYGCHHTKLFLTGFDDQVSSEGGRGSTRQSMIRVVVHTANLGASDVEYQTNGFYAQNFPLKKKTVEQRSSIVNPYKIATKGGGVDSTSAAAKSTCSFENDLAEYLESYNYNTLQSWCAPTLGGSMDIREARLKRFGQGYSSTAYPLQQAVNTKDTSRILTSQELSLADLIRQYDYSSAYAVLIPSVPGYHTGMAIKKYGYLKLRQEIIDVFPSSQSLGEKKKKKKPPMVCQISSLGSLNEKWLRKFCSALDYTSTHHTNPLDDNCMSAKPFQSLVKIIWPTTDEIRNSVEGVEGGGSVPGRESNLQKSFLKPLYHRWSKRDSRKDPFLTARHVPHIKTIIQPSPSFGNDRSIEWLLLSSHNLSKAAWGQVQNNKRSGGKDCFISHWELGVMFSPATLLEVCGMTKPVRILPIGYDEAEVNGTISLCDDGDDDDGSSDFINVRVPLPYDVHMPDAYDGRDEYWTVN